MIKKALAVALLATSTIASATKEQDTSAQILRTPKITGVMQCQASGEDIPGANRDIYGCKTKKGKMISIVEFFKQNRRSRSHEIIDIVYSNHENVFLIYYGSIDD